MKLPRDTGPILFTIALVAVVLWVLVWPFTDILLRLYRNGKVADALVASLTAQFPGVSFQGGASYRDEIVFIWVLSELGVDQRKEVERWLRREKAQRKIGPAIRIQLPDDAATEREPLVIE